MNDTTGGTGCDSRWALSTGEASGGDLLYTVRRLPKRDREARRQKGGHVAADDGDVTNPSLIHVTGRA